MLNYALFDPRLIAIAAMPVKAKRDPYRLEATQMFGVTYNAVTRTQRAQAKAKLSGDIFALKLGALPGAEAELISLATEGPSCS